jgi:glycosyltransferase involved in cell wall biosynthesis
MDSELPLVSVLFVTYKRVNLLQAAIEAFRRNTQYPNLQIVIADDGSQPEIQAAIRKLPADVFALSPKNRGLGANANNGISHCTGKYILMVQDDWLCSGPPDYLLQSVQVMEQNPHVGLINYAGGPNLPDKSQRLSGSDEPCYIVWQIHEDDPGGSYLYSDQPHMHSRAALDYVGPYLETRQMEDCERDYEIRWSKQDKFATALFPGYFMQVFRNNGVQDSLRTKRMRYRIDAVLLPTAKILRQRCKPAFVLGRFIVRTAQSTLEALRIVK